MLSCRGKRKRIGGSAKEAEKACSNLARKSRSKNQPLCTLTDSLLQMWTTEWVRGRECSPEGMARRTGTSAIISKFELGHDRPVRES
jgi:hypothetical protein